MAGGGGSRPRSAAGGRRIGRDDLAYHRPVGPGESGRRQRGQGRQGAWTTGSDGPPTHRRLDGLWLAHH
ncbi:hypothetical protein BGU32_18410 [Clostridioides difficile]|nr:hypothetical protein BGU32_18410 [Clostridioides difficile]